MTRTISEIYESYQIPPWLADHMYRVAAVAMSVFDARKEKDPSLSGLEDLVIACLLHDIGNVIKFDLDRFPAPDGRTDHWKKVQEGMIGKYGKDELAAAAAISEELGVIEKIGPVLENTSDKDALVLERSGTMLQKIACYADQRVSPSGVIPLRQRLADMRARYAHPDDEHTRALDAATVRIEEFLFGGLSIDPDDITDESIADIVGALRAFEI